MSAPDWIPIEQAPEEVRVGANASMPGLGELIYKIFQAKDANLWVVQFNNPASRPLRAYMLPKVSP